MKKDVNNSPQLDQLEKPNIANGWYVTSNNLRAYSPCVDGWTKFLSKTGKIKGDDEITPIQTILELNGFKDALWSLRGVHGKDTEIRLYAVYCARLFTHLMKDKSSLQALDIAEKYAKGDASEIELAKSRSLASGVAVGLAKDVAKSVALISPAEAAMRVIEESELVHKKTGLYLKMIFEQQEKFREMIRV